jgi:hypothetical protein
MYKSKFGKNCQVRLDGPDDYYEFLGFLSRDDGTTKLFWEPNDNSGAWAPEGRIHFYVDPPPDLSAHLSHTAGRGDIVSRVNCNEFVEHIMQYHNFRCNDAQDQAAIRATIPADHLEDFDRGRAL